MSYHAQLAGFYANIVAGFAADIDTWHISSTAILDRAKEEQGKRYEEDPWALKVRDHVAHKDSVKVPDVLEFLINDTSRLDMSAQNRVVKILRHLGWRSKRTNKERYWVRPGSIESDTW